MKKRTFLKKALSLLMVAVMTVGIAPLSTFASTDANLSATETETIYGTEGIFSYEIENEEVTIIRCDQSASGDIIIPSTLAGYPVTSIGGHVFAGCESFISITVPDSVTSIGDSAFSYCESLISITIPDSVTSIGNSAFSYCESLKSITIPDSVTSIGNSAFSFCESLKSIEIPSSVTNIGDFSFEYCRSLESITVDENNKNYSSDEYGVFFNRDKTTLIQYPVGNTRTSYIIPDSVTSIVNGAFYSCYYLENIVIPDSVKKINFMTFSYSYNLKSLTLGNGIEKIEECPFAYTSLEEIIIPSSVQVLGNHSPIDLFYNVTNTIKKIIVDEDNPNYSSDENGVLFNKDKNVLYLYPNGKTEKEYVVPVSVQTIGYCAFSDRANEHFDLISYDYEDFIELFEADLGFEYKGNPNFNTVEVLYIGKNVKVIEENAFYSSDITDIHYAGSEEEWNKIDIQDTIPENITIHFNSLPCEHINKTFVKYTSHPEHYVVCKCVDCEEEITDTVVNKLEECEECYPECKHTNTYTKITKEPTCNTNGTGREICSDCGEIVSAIAIPASHSWGEWKITKTPTDKSDGEKQRLCTACFMAEAVVIPKLDVQIGNEETGIIVGVPEGAYENDIELVVEQQADDTAYEITSVIDGVVNSVVFDITTKVNGEETQPKTPVIVKIPVPANFNKNKTFLYHQSGEDYEKINYKIENNYIVFEASQFSYYSLVELEIVSIKVEKTPATTELTYKSDVSADGLKVIAVYSDGSEVDVTENVNITNFDTSEKGDRTAAVEFEGKTATFNYTVKYIWWQWLILIFLLGFIWY